MFSPAQQELRLLKQALHLQDEGHSKGAFATDEDGDSIGALDLRAVAWCCVGSLVRASCDLGTSDVVLGNATRRMKRYSVACGYDSLMEWNDKSRMADVRKGFVYAIGELEEASGG